jgi:hypothetical protein
VLWFLLTLAAVTSGRWWTAVVMSVTGALAAAQLVRVWATALRPRAAASGVRGPALVAAAAVVVATVAAAVGTGTAGAVLVLLGGLGWFVLRAAGPGGDGPAAIGTALPIAAILPAVATVSVVLAVRVDLWAGLFLVLAVSLYDAGSYLLGAEASGRWEGPVAGALGALGVTFTVATVQLGPFDRVQWWIAGVVVASTCVVGQSVATAFLPASDTWAPGLRRLDAYVVSGPAFLLCAWLLG